MYYFYKEDTGEIVQRKHQYNSEALDGLIVPTESDDRAYLLVHIPNRSFGWDVSIVESYKIKKGYEKWQEIGSSQNVEEGKPYYNLVLKESLKDYIEQNDKLTLVNDAVKDREETSTAAGSVDSKDEVPEVSDRKPYRESDEEEEYQIRLMRDEEKPIKS